MDLWTFLRHSFENLKPREHNAELLIVQGSELHNNLAEYLTMQWYHVRIILYAPIYLCFNTTIREYLPTNLGVMTSSTLVFVEGEFANKYADVVAVTPSSH